MEEVLSVEGQRMGWQVGTAVAAVLAVESRVVARETFVRNRASADRAAAVAVIRPFSFGFDRHP
jgi:hypothetical protein